MLKRSRVAIAVSVGAVVRLSVEVPPFAGSARGPPLAAIFNEDAFLGRPLLLLCATTFEGVWQEDPCTGAVKTFSALACAWG